VKQSLDYCLRVGKSLYWGGGADTGFGVIWFTYGTGIIKGEFAIQIRRADQTYFKVEEEKKRST